MKRLVAFALLVACARPSTSWDDPAVRRAALERSLERDTPYARLRKAQFDAWMALPEETPIAIPAAARAGDLDALRALGREAFFRNPVQRAPEGARESVHGLQHLVAHHGAPHLTCATCHANGDVVGAANEALDLGAALIDAHPRASPEAEAIARAWGKGRVDVSSADGREPARIPDLRPVRFHRHLQWSGAVKQVDVTSLAMRIETLMITSGDGAHRPPPVLSLAIATFLWSLGDAKPLPAAPRAFVETCGGCHEGDGLAGDLVDVDEVGTDPTLARSVQRGTGMYRVPSLRFVSTRGGLMHDGSLTLATLLDPSRGGGHRFGLDRPAEERAAIAAFLRAL